MKKVLFPYLLFLAAPAHAEVILGNEQIERAGIYAGGIALVLLTLMLLHALHSSRRLAGKNRDIEAANRTLRAFIQSQGDIAYLKDDQFRYLYANGATERLYGMEANALIGKDDYAISDAASADQRRLTDVQTLTTKEIVYATYETNGCIYKVTKFPVPLSNGKTGIGANARDITDETRAARRTRMESRRLKALSSIVARSFDSVQDQLAYVLEEAVALTASQYGFIFLYDEKTETLTSTILSKAAQEDSILVPNPSDVNLKNAGKWGDVIRSRKPVLLNDFSNRKGNYPAGHLQIRRFLSLPILMDGIFVAAIGLANEEKEYEDADVDELTLLMAGLWHDIRRREMLSRLRFERERYFQTLVSIGDGVMVTDADGKIEILNRVAEDLAGVTTAEVAGKHYLDVIKVKFTNDNPADPVAKTLQTGMVTAMGQGTVLIARDGTEHALEDCAAPIRDETGRIAGAVLVFRDVTQKKAQMEKITYMSFHDALTGLYNRRYLTEAFMRLSQDEQYLPLAVVMGDLNGLKLTNDIFGHAAGDTLLEKIAAVLRRTGRAEDVIGRWGGDEFLALLPRTDHAGAVDFISRVKTAFGQERVRMIKGSIAMGFACKERPEENAQVVFSMAEDAMYNAKAFARDDAYRATVDELIQSLHRISPREKIHSEAVRVLSMKIARALNLSEDEVHKVGAAGYLHDVGKIVLSAEILDESRPLNDLEWNEIRRHPIVGYRVLNTFEDTMDIAEPVLAHHERWDGHGYPRGLKGDQIPLLARILAVAEASDSMSKQSLTTSAIVSELRANAGTQFDSKIVEAFARTMGNT